MLMLLDKVRATIEDNSLLEYGDSVICAVSGGADSICLLHIMNTLKSEYGLRLYIANVNHLIRGEESDRDSRFVKAIAKAADIDFFYREYDVRKIASERKIGEEECGRELRYEFFRELSQKLGGAKIATAHNLNDNAETILFRMARGTSPKGLCGIKYKRDNIVRPLLDVSRGEIERYLKANSITWCEDSTNSIPIYARNKIRLNVMPQLREISSSAEEKIVSVSRLIWQDNSFIEDYTKEQEKVCIEGNDLILEPFLKLHPSIKRRITTTILKKWGVKEISAEKVESFLNYVQKDTGKVFDINGKIFARKSYERIVTFAPEESKEFCAVLDEGKSVITDKWKLCMYYSDEIIRKRNNSVAIFDADKICGPFTVTYRRDGDRISIKGLNGSKKISDIFTDEKIDISERNFIPVVRKDDDIIYIGGIRQSSLYMADSDTKKYLIITYEERDD